MTDQTFKKQIKNKGYIRISANKFLPVYFKITFEKYNSETLDCEIGTIQAKDSKSIELLKVLSKLLNNDIFIHEKPNSRRGIKILGIFGWRGEKTKFNLDISGFEYGFYSLPNKIFPATAYLSGNHILSRPTITERSYEGKVVRKINSKNEITWKTRFGKGICTTLYAYEDISLEKNPANLELEIPVIFYEILAKRKQNLDVIKSEIERDLKIACLILSFSYRQTIKWYQLDIPFELRNKGIPRISQALSRKKGFHSKAPRKQEELINYENLSKKGMEKLIEAFRNLAQDELLERIIYFLNGSYAEGYTETRYFQCFSALDSLTEFLTNTYIPNKKLPKSKWMKLEKELKGFLKGFSKTYKLGPIINTIIAKLPDLKRISTIEKISTCCKKYRIKTDDLWTTFSFEEGLRRSIKIRNQLVHGATIDEHPYMELHLKRLQILTERLLIKLFKYPKNKLWVWRDKVLKEIPF